MPATRNTTPCRILFAELRPAAHLHLDVIVHGTPASIEARLPSEAWAAAALIALEHWVGEGRQVDLEIRRVRDTVRAAISSDFTWLLLDLESEPQFGRPVSHEPAGRDNEPLPAA